MCKLSGKLPAYADLDSWCSCCGSILHQYESLFWVEPDDFQIREHDRPPYPEISGFFVAICERCYAEDMPAVPHDKTKTPFCSLCSEETSFEDCKWVDTAYFDPPADYAGAMFTDITGHLFLICPTCYLADVDLYLGLLD